MGHPAPLRTALRGAEGGGPEGMSPVTVTQALGLWGPWTSGIHSHLQVTWLGTVTCHWKHEHRGRRLCALPRPALGSGLPPPATALTLWGPPKGCHAPP